MGNGSSLGEEGQRWLARDEPDIDRDTANQRQRRLALF